MSVGFVEFGEILYNGLWLWDLDIVGVLGDILPTVESVVTLSIIL